MPSSSSHIIPFVCEAILLRQPRRILDIGIGYGKYGLLAREYTDIVHQRPAHTTKVDGIEIFREYIGPVQRAIYDAVYVGDAVDLLPKLGKIKKPYDLAICVDVLEHMTRERGEQLLEGIAGAAKYGIVTTPVKMLPQGTTWGNVYETHVCEWTEAQLAVYGTVYKIGRVKPTWALTMP